MELGLGGRVALVAASSRGLGRATAEALAAEGARLTICGRSPEALTATETALRAAGAEVLSVEIDVTEPSSPARLVEATVERYGSLDIVVPNAGGPPPGRALDVDDQALHLAIEANLMTSVRLVREAVPHMRATGWGRICCIASYSVVQPIPELALSNTARVGLWGWLKTAAKDLVGTGVTLNMICPGPHATDRMIQLQGPLGDTAGDAASAPAMGDPADFGRIVAFLCSERARFISGAAIVVDGGSTLAL
jgi:3-oxoacyl-[acyl-carrier protein] reductase